MLEDQVLNTINFVLSVNSAFLLLVAALGASEAYLDVKAVRTLHIFNGRRALADGNLQGTALGALSAIICMVLVATLVNIKEPDALAIRLTLATLLALLICREFVNTRTHRRAVK